MTAPGGGSIHKAWRRFVGGEAEEVIPNDMDGLRALRARDSDLRRYAALEFGRRDAPWAAAGAESAPRLRRRGWLAAVVAYLSPR